MEIILKEAKKNLAGILIIDCLLVLYGILSKTFDYYFVMGILLGSILSYLNFIALGVVSQKALMRNPVVAQKRFAGFFVIRLLLLFFVYGVLIYFNVANPIALIMPLLAPKITYLLLEHFKKEG